MCAAWALVRVPGAEHGYPAVPLMAYTLYVVPVSILAAAVGVVLRQWTAAALSGLAAISLLTAIAPRALGGPDDVSGRPLRVMSANLLHGSADASTLDRLVRDHDVDVLAVQELTPGFARSFRSAGGRQALPYAVLSVNRGVTGSGIYSRLPILEQVPIPGIASTRAIVSVGSTQLDLTSVHNVPLPNTSADINLWARRLHALPGAQAEGPVRLLVGDFNATFDQSDFRDVVGHGYADAGERMGDGLLPTWPVRDPGWRYMPVTIDHVLYDRDRVGVRDYDLLDLPASDHRTIYAELVLRTPGT